jgi:hypothetical protein
MIFLWREESDFRRFWWNVERSAQVRCKKRRDFHSVHGADGHFVLLVVMVFSQ